MGLAVDEQETSIIYMRDEKFARVYTSDTTQMTRLDKLCATSPDMWQLEEETLYGKKYICKDKSLISFRSKKTSRELTDEQRAEMAERLRNVRVRDKD